MPRTKQVIVSEKPKESILAMKEAEATSLQEFTRLYETKRRMLIERKEASITALKLTMKRLKLSLPVSIKNKKIHELSRLGNFSTSFQSSLGISMLGSASSIKNNYNVNKDSDDGYVTYESNNTNNEKSTASRSRSITKSNEASNKPTRMTRSLSRNSTKKVGAVLKSKRTSKSVERSNDHYKTPMNLKTLDSFGMVTPKVKPNSTHVILRRPQQGEMAISLQGSPLMTSAVVTETIANVNIPLPDGRMINIQPMRGIRPSEIPEFDPEMRRQLMTLKENLEQVCQFVKK